MTLMTQIMRESRSKASLAVKLMSKAIRHYGGYRGRIAICR